MSAKSQPGESVGGTSKGWTVHPKQGAWEWDAWVGAERRFGTAMSRSAAERKAKDALVNLEWSEALR